VVCVVFDFFSQGKFEEAVEVFERSIKIFQKALGPTHVDLATSLSNLGCVLIDFVRQREGERETKGRMRE